MRVFTAASYSWLLQHNDTGCFLHVMQTASYEFLMKPKESARCNQTLSTHAGSLLPTLHAPPGEKRSGKRSRISWTYSPKRWKTNEIARSLIIT